MGVLIKEKGSEKRGQCGYCYNGELAFDEQSGRVFCESCGYAIELPVRKANINTQHTIDYNPEIKYLKNDVELAVELPGEYTFQGTVKYKR